MSNVNTIRKELARCHDEGYSISERALRSWVKQGLIPSVSIGNRKLVLHDNVVKFLRCESEAAL